MSNLEEQLLPRKSETFRTNNVRVLKNIILLAMAWALTLTTSTLLTTIGPLSAIELGASNSFAAFAIGVFLLGAAVSSVPSARLFAKYGRFAGFTMGCVCQVIGSIVGAAAMGLQWLPLIYIGCFFVGLGQGLGQFYRFSAVEVSPPLLKTKAITYVLAGGIFAAFLGPVCAEQTSNLDPDHKFLGSYLIIALIGLLNEITICFVDFPRRMIPPSTKNTSPTPNNQSINDSPEPMRLSIMSKASMKPVSMMDIMSRRSFMLSCFVATIAHTIMVMLMSDVTLAMKDYGYSLSATSLVMEMHFFAMFSPGFVSGKMIFIMGPFAIAVLGGVILAASDVVFLMGTQAWNFYLGMILLGIGWNFSFSAGTVMLTESYEPREAASVQALNDFILFTIAGIGSLAAGFIYSSFGWQVTVYVSIGMVVINLIVFALNYWLKEPDSRDSFFLSTKDALRASNFSEIFGDNNTTQQDLRTISENDEESETANLVPRSKSFDFMRAISFDDMDATSRMRTIQSVSVT